MKNRFFTKILLYIIISIFPFALFAANSDIRLNSVGYLPNNQKKASIIIACTTFNVIRVPAGTTALTGNVTGPVTDSDSGQSIRTADFSSLTETGTFYLQVPGVGQSYEFEIKPDLYNSQYYTAMRGMYLWRASMAVSGTHNSITYSHPGGHYNDGDEYYSRSPNSHVYKDGDGGWYDAGDYGRYTVNAGITMGFFFKAWDEFKPFILATELNIPESAGALPDYLEELKYELNWLFKMRYWDGSGKVHHKLTTMSHAGWVMPQNDTAQLYFTETSSAATADFVAIMAMAYRAFLPYDVTYANQCLGAASLSYNYLRANTANDPSTDPTSTGGYGTTDSDDRLWAAVEFWEATGNTAAHADLVTRFGGFSNKVRASLTTSTVFGWNDVESLASITYFASTRTGKDSAIITDIQNDIVTAANSIVTTRNGHGYGRTMGTTYFWGCNGHMGNQVMLLLAANKISPNNNYIETSLDTLNYLYGRNYYNRSFITGLGDDPPMNPHDRRSASDGIAAPWPGYLVGGSSTNVTGWNDLAANLDTNYSYNEIAINWQAPLVYTLAAFSGIVGTPTNTPTFTRTRTPTYTRTQTYTPSPTRTRTATPTYTRTILQSPTFTATATRTGTPTYTRTIVQTMTFTATGTRTVTPTYTRTIVQSKTFTATGTRTVTPTYTRTTVQSLTFTATGTRTVTPSYTRTVVQTFTFTVTLTNTATPTFTVTRTNTALPTSTGSASNTATYTRTVTGTPTFTRTATRTNTPYQSPTYTPSVTVTVTGTAPTSTATPTITVTSSGVPSASYTPTVSNTATATRTMTFTPVNTASNTPVNTAVNTATRTNTPVNTVTNTPVNTSTNTPVNTLTYTHTIIPTGTFTRTVTGTFTATETFTQTSTRTATPSITQTWTGTQPTMTFTPTVTVTSTESPTGTVTGTNTGTNTATNTPVNTATNTPVNTATNTSTNTPTNTRTSTPTSTRTSTRTSTPTSTPTNTRTNTPVDTVTRTYTITLTFTATRTSTPANTATLTHTPVPTITLTSTAAPTPDTFEITEPVPYPNPYNPSLGQPSYFSCNLTQDAENVKLKIYTTGFRAVKVIEIQGVVPAGRLAVKIEARELSRLAAGSYYYVFTGEGLNNQKAKSRTAVFVIMK